MQGDLQAFLWADLSDVRARVQQIEAALHALQRAIDEGRVDQPSRQDSQRLNRLLVLAELLSGEVRPWIERLGGVVLPVGSGNGTTASGNGANPGKPPAAAS